MFNSDLLKFHLTGYCEFSIFAPKICNLLLEDVRSIYKLLLDISIVVFTLRCLTTAFIELISL